MGLGRLAGLAYLGASVLIIAAGVLRAPIFVSDAAATIANVRAAETIVRVAIAAEIGSFTLFLLTAILLYAVLGGADRVAALSMVVFSAVGTVLGCLAVANELSVLSVALQAPGGPLASDAPRFVTLFAEAHRSALMMTDLTSGLWLLPMGYLVIRAVSFPTAIGVALIVGGFAWLARLLIQVLAPGLSGLVGPLALGSLSEIALIAWLIAKGAPFRSVAA